MKSAWLGVITSRVEVTNISRHGLWLMVGDEELLLPFDEFPWFKDASLQAILNVEWRGPDHLHWPALDVDLTLESIRHPEKYPLVSKGEVQQSATADSSPEQSP
jgi:hypothetical protein